MREVKRQDVEETTSEVLDGTLDTAQDGVNGDPDNAEDSVNTSNNGDEPGSHHLHKKAKTTHTPNFAVEASANDTPSADPNVSNGSTYSYDSEAAKTSQSPQARMCPEALSTRRRTATAPNEHFAGIVHGTSEYETSDDELLSSPASGAFHSRYRQSRTDLMTLHMFTGLIRGGKTPIYVPVYKRSNAGKLLKLAKSWSGRWDYVEVKKLMEEEEEAGLKIFEEPKAEAVVESSEPKRAGGRRTLADFGLPETEPKGGWGWL